MSETSQCRTCHQPIVWHKSKAGKPYPCDSDDRRDFHQCSGPKPAPTPAPPPPPPLGASLSERVDALESTVTALVRQLRELGTRLPIDDRDVAF